MIDFEEHTKKLRSVNGYLGSAILNFAGETLYLDEDNTGIDIAYSASIFNDAFRMVSESSLDIGFAEASFVETKTYDGHVFLINSSGYENSEQFSRINIFSIFTDDGNVALAKMIIDRISKNISEDMKDL
ncbi:hypothetical protein MNB_SV-9-783 [hydrothermal vent metagenome]|uniref:Roadblock/LAMTOR2 domain-containing protein n=1 Tax=hydrothermal vent metagenome TaxID=652676 RepID=A0A1W1C3Y5_9ZZZZ